MLVSEILRIKGNTLYTTTPDGAVMDAVKVMADNDIGSLVVMEGGRLVGMLTFREVLAAMAERDGSLAGVKVADIFEHDPLTAAPALDVMELRRTMLERHARYVPVMDGRRCRASCRSTTWPRPSTTSRTSKTACSSPTSRTGRTSSRASADRCGVRPAARTAPGASQNRAWSRRLPVARAVPRSIVSVGSVRSAAMHTCVAGCSAAAMAPSIASLR